MRVQAVSIPSDMGVRRVFWRLGFVKDRNGLKEIQQVAGGLSGRVGIAQLDLDCVLWSIGDVCGERRAS